VTESSSPSALEKLGQRLAAGSLHHGLLFHGNDLNELERQARNLAGEALLMPNESSEHPDLFHLRPSGKMRIISVDKTRALIGELNRSSNQGGAKVALVHEADRMKKAAANAFLKTLEEPPPSTFLFLLTTRPYSILPTILSRCLQVRTSNASTHSNDPDWEEWLKAYTDWINLMLDRKKLMGDRTTPVFAAYGLAERMIALIKRKSDEECKSQLKELARDLDDKEKDALEVGIRKGIRSRFLRELSEGTRKIALLQPSSSLTKNGIKLSRIISNLERNAGLMEVNLKDEVAFENFWLSSLRIWSSK
jgi:DNA polymerase III subunit delta'